MTGTLSQQWINRAEEDLAVARLVLDEQYTAPACFLSQQCIEKSLKAFLLATVNSYPRTHKVVDWWRNVSVLTRNLAGFIPIVW